MQIILTTYEDGSIISWKPGSVWGTSGEYDAPYRNVVAEIPENHEPTRVADFGTPDDDGVYRSAVVESQEVPAVVETQYD